MKTLMTLVCALIAPITLSLAAFGQNAIQPASATSSLENNIELLRRDLRSEKKQLIAANVPLTDAEATRFWPVYDQYIADMKKANDAFYDIVKNYTDNQKTWTDTEATSFLDRWGKAQMEQAKTRQKYIPLIGKVIPAKKAALFFQIDRRLFLLMDLQVLTHLPLVTQ